MRVIVTCGPSYEPIDEVRRLTNFSTGELGILLTNRLAEAGHEVLCFKGVGATCPARVAGARVIPFTTNANLRAELGSLEAREEIGAVFHAAALCDYGVRSVQTSTGEELAARKIPSRSGELILLLTPAPKILPALRVLFPRSRIVGWKYELNGGREDAVTAAERQIREGLADASVANGHAYGAGYGFRDGTAEVVHLATKAALCEQLVRWLVQPG